MLTFLNNLNVPKLILQYKIQTLSAPTENECHFQSTYVPNTKPVDKGSTVVLPPQNSIELGSILTSGTGCMVFVSPPLVFFRYSGFLS